MSGVVTIVVEPAGPPLLEEGLQHLRDHFKVLNAPAQFAVGARARAVPGEPPSTWLRSCPPYRRTLKRVSCAGVAPLVFSQDGAAKTLRSLDQPPAPLAHTAYGAREGYISHAGTYYGHPSFDLTDMLTRQDITCVVKDRGTEDKMGPCRSWCETWTYESDRRGDADALYTIDKENLLPLDKKVERADGSFLRVCLPSQDGQFHEDPFKNKE